MESKEMNFAAIPQTALNVVTKPSAFFKGMPKSGGFMEPLVFVVMIGVITGVIQAMINLTGFGQNGGYEASIKASISMILFMPIFAAVFSFIGAAVLFAIWKLMGSQENYETAYRCAAYLIALTPITTIIGVIPYAGGIISMVMYLFYLVTASIHVHNIPSQKAWLVFGIIIAILLLFGLSTEYKVRKMAASGKDWRDINSQISKEYENKAKDMGKTADEARRQAQQMAGQAKKQAEQSR